MKRFLTTAMLLGLFAPFGLVGCAEKAKVETTETVATPTGTTTTTDTKEIKSTEPPASNPAEATAAPK